ncbi:polysaccharide deacetylase family protein [Streptomyces sp. AM 4-1-1]|uniref:polysaccharide deacetylase family protein n=1 Tax=Streptomyces sp. AM 4-1-1 TaxID=3028710 RepID=UPI0023B9B52F|nr:polysaccharide deacetylase family protein [Streptomyces sp. AM 4-1-1]WEH35142.1 polysaccharide deacetylase family protein [Streptomyces sp. AM 4-1-1]
MVNPRPPEAAGTAPARPFLPFAATALAVAGWHIGPAATWLPPVRRALAPALDGRGAPDRVALTFDDGPDPDSTPHFLRALDRLSVRATFFVLGERLRLHPELGRRMVAEGHELAVHGWRHERPWRPRPARDTHELRRAVETVVRVTGTRPVWYRPPYGILTGGRWAAARRLGLRPVLWSAWGRDWTARATPDSVLAEVTSALRGGGTVLLHDSDAMSAPGSWRASLGALPGLAAVCHARGLTLGPLAVHGLRPPPGDEPYAYVNAPLGTAG